MGGLLLYLCLGKARWCRGWMGVVVVVGWVCPWWLRLLSLCVCDGDAGRVVGDGFSVLVQS